MPSWDPASVGDLSDRTVLVTGGNSGIGLEACRMLAARGATVVLGARSRAKGEQAAADVRRSAGTGRVEVLEVDLADLGSVAHAAEEVAEHLDALAVLVNNAGVMALPHGATADGLELQMGTNHYGHFALTGHLLPLLLAARGARVVTVSSLAHRAGRTDLARRDGHAAYDKWRTYGDSKLANLLFTFELQRRAEGADADLIALACHPGYAATNLQRRGPELEGSRVKQLGMRVLNTVLGQSARAGALPTVYAAASPEAAGGDFIGPHLRGWRGSPTTAEPRRAAKDPGLAAALWTRSEELTGVSYDWSAVR